MKRQQLRALDRRLSQFLQNLLEPLGRSERRHWARVYLEGLLLDGERKSIQHMAKRIPGCDVQSLRQFVGQSPWAVDEIQKRLALKITDLLSDAEVWILDETSFPKAGRHSVGVARQYCGTLGKVANCQVSVTLHWSNAQASCPLGWKLYIPSEWFEDPERVAKAKIPSEVEYQSKPDLAVELLDQTISWGVPTRPVLADSAYGNGFGFREKLRSRGLSYAVQVEPSTVVWDQDPNIGLPPPKQRGRPRRYPPLASLPQPLNLLDIALSLRESAWQIVEWREGTRGPQRSRFARIQIWAAHGWRKQEHPQRVPEVLLIEWPEEENAPTKYWLACFGDQELEMRQLVRIARARWRIELDYREMKEELGLDHYEGRHWLGWHHHVTLVTLAFAFLRAEQARIKKNFWCDLASDEEITSGGVD